jgi:RNA polymerase sigma-70 factor (ECF subfamily)
MVLGFITSSETESRSSRFDRLVLPHLDAAYNLARWLARDPRKAEDIVQDAFVRALRFFDGFRGDDARPWLLAIVRNTFFTSLKRGDDEELRADIEDERGTGIPLWGNAGNFDQDPVIALMRKADRDRIDRALARLPLEFREVVILRELEGMSYKEIAEMADVPIGTVMSRLARARKQLQQFLVQRLQPGVSK